MMKRFREKIVVVTGAGLETGRATAIRFANEGAHVVLVGDTLDTLKATAEELPKDHTWIHTDDYLTIACDSSDKAQVEEMIKRVIDRFNKIDIVVNNIEIITQNTSTVLSHSDGLFAIEAKLNNIAHICQTAMPHLIASQGNIINVSSLSEVSDDSKATADDATKVGITTLTRTLALRHGANGIRVNAVNPSLTTADISLACYPLGRLATPKDIAAAVTFLASDDAAMITGVNLPVDGGMHAVSPPPEL